MSRKKAILIGLTAAAIAAGIWTLQSWLYSAPSDLPDLSIEDQLVSAGVVQDGVPSIDDPSFESVAAADEYLKDEGEGLVVEAGGSVRFYPYQILVWHEIVNDTFDGKAVVITYCPFCHSGLVFERDLGGEVGVVEFGVSGKLLDSNSILYDRTTNSLWAPVLGRAIVGELTGTELTTYPSTVMTWQEFKSEFPQGEVLSRETGASRDYTRNPYERYQGGKQVWFPVSHTDDRLDAKTVIYGVKTESGFAAYTQAAWDALADTDKPEAAQQMYWFCWVVAHPETEMNE